MHDEIAKRMLVDVLTIVKHKITHKNGPVIPMKEILHLLKIPHFQAYEEMGRS
jgi:hypothetical protein